MIFSKLTELCDHCKVQRLEHFQHLQEIPRAHLQLTPIVATRQLFTSFLYIL